MHCPCFHIPKKYLRMSLRYREGKSKLVSHKGKKKTTKNRGTALAFDDRSDEIFYFVKFRINCKIMVFGDRIKHKTIEPKFPCASGKNQVLGCSRFFSFVLL